MNSLSKIISLIGIIFSVILFLVSIKINFFGSDIQLDPLVRSILVFIISLLISESLARIAAKNELDKHHNKINSILESKVDCRTIGSTQKALDYVIYNLPKVEYVENTHVKVGSYEQDGIYNSRLYNKYIATLKKEISNGLIWSDILGESSINRKKQLIEWAQVDPQKRRYLTKIIPNNVPIVNHVTLKYKDGSKETLFGWASQMEKPHVQVFASKNLEVIGFFQQYFNDLALLDMK